MGCGQSKIHLYPRKSKSKTNGKKSGNGEFEECLYRGLDLIVRVLDLSGCGCRGRWRGTQGCGRERNERAWEEPTVPFAERGGWKQRFADRDGWQRWPGRVWAEWRNNNSDATWEESIAALKPVRNWVLSFWTSEINCWPLSVIFSLLVSTTSSSCWTKR